MAITTKKSLPKTKTKAVTKKSASTTKAEPKGVKVTKATKPAKVSTFRRDVAFEKLRGLNMFAAGVYLLLAVLAGVFMSNTAYQLSLGHLAKDDLVSGSAIVFAPAVQFVFDFELRWAVVAIMLLSAVTPVLYLTKLQKRYADYVQNTRMVPFRWIDLGITTALMVEVVALLSGVNDIMTLKLIGGTVLVTSLLGLVAERQNNAASKPVWSAFYTSLFSGALPWLLVAVYAVATVVYGEIRTPWYVYALYAFTLGGFIALVWNQRNQHKKVRSWQSYLFVERNYLGISIFTKTAFAIILISGLLR